MPTSTSSLIFHEIEKNPKKSISFARYMELALYSEPEGYYAQRASNKIGRGGDFYTSVSVGETYGMLLGQAADRLWRDVYLEKDGFCLVEQGAHDGQLARDIIKHRPLSEGSWRYCIIEPSSNARLTLSDSLRGTGIEVVASAAEIDADSGLFLCNELVDAFPVHRIRKRGDDWVEIAVTSEDGTRFRATEEALSSSRLKERVAQLDSSLPDQYTTEINLAIDPWIAEISQLFTEKGHFWIIDYGYESDDYYHPDRKEGTLRCYANHKAADEPLDHPPGSVDITAHVDFGAIIRTAQAFGLRPIGPLRDQHHFLIDAARPWLQEIESDGTAASDPATRTLVRQFATLTHPGLMGRAFKILELEKQATPCDGSLSQ